MRTALLGNLIKNALSLTDRTQRLVRHSPLEMQEDELRHLLHKARNTAFGKHYGFRELLHNYPEDTPPLVLFEAFRRAVPVFDYDSLFEAWWHRTLQGEEDVCWPGRIQYFALTSGTSGAPSKRIPITEDLTKAIQRTSRKQLLTLAKMDLPPEAYESDALMLGGSTNLNYNGVFYEGDVSGIQASQMPFWFNNFYKPGRDIASVNDWHEKLDLIAQKAPEWDIGALVGVPTWHQIMLERIIEHNKLATIHDIWPNLQLFVHGGVAFGPYKATFERLLAHPLHYLETYLASEGFLAYQAQPNVDGMRLSMDTGIFFEFIPFTESNFDEEGRLYDEHQVVTVEGLQEGKEYAVLISTVAGTWRYLIGDVVKCVDREQSEIVITGRTKHYLSLCGEHLSVDNMNDAIKAVDEKLDLGIKEFTLTGSQKGTVFAHHWYLGAERPDADPEEVRQILDQELRRVNTDYGTRRDTALQPPSLTLLPNRIFYQFLERKGKVGGQNKFPRVLKKPEQKKEWKDYLNQEGIRITEALDPQF